MYAMENAQSNAWLDLNVDWSSSGATGIIWKIQSATGITNDLWRWSVIGGFVTNATNHLTWTGGAEATNRNYVVRLGCDTNANGQLEPGEYAFYLNARVMRWDYRMGAGAAPALKS